jgi:hypothetical protein
MSDKFRMSLKFETYRYALIHLDRGMPEVAALAYNFVGRLR